MTKYFLINEFAYQVALTVEIRFSPASLDEHIGRERLFYSVNFADLQEDHMEKDRDLHATADRQNLSITHGEYKTTQSSDQLLRRQLSRWF